MKTIARWSDLEPYGVIPLTLEADALGYRILCDFTAKGRTILLRALGIPDISLCEPWNRRTETGPHVGSAMLAHSLLELLGVFALLEAGVKEVWVFKNGCALGIEETDDQEGVQIMEAFSRKDIARKLCPAPTGDRNQHVFTGRIE